jgi:hypothetical protein
MSKLQTGRSSTLPLAAIGRSPRRRADPRGKVASPTKRGDAGVRFGPGPAQTCRSPGSGPGRRRVQRRRGWCGHHPPQQGNNTVCGGRGDDTLHLGAGFELIDEDDGDGVRHHTRSGSDVLHGAEGNETLRWMLTGPCDVSRFDGGPGRDRIELDRGRAPARSRYPCRIAIVFSAPKPCSAANPFSRPWPLRLTPPKGSSIPPPAP